MHYFIRYHKKTGEITGAFRSSTNEFVPKPLTAEEENLEVTDEKQVELLGALKPRTTRLRGTVDSGKIRTLKAEPVFRGRIELSCDLPDRDGDGVPELPADGKAVARIRATLRGPEDRVLAKEVATVRFQVNRGSLSKRQAQTEKGVAEVELQAVAETVRIRVIAAAEGFERASLELETIPPEEHRALVKAESRKAG